jgi:hypothetical protein
MSVPIPFQNLPIPPCVPGKFDYIQDMDYKKRLVNAFQAVTLTESWSFLKRPCESFMFSNDPKIDVITKKMVELGYSGHSGSSFGCTMRDMQFIALRGEEEFRDVYLEYIK